MQGRTRNTRPTPNPSQSRKKKRLIGIVVGIIIVVALGFLIWFLIMKARRDKSETDLEIAQNAAAAERVQGVTNKAPEDLSDPWWQNPSNVALYVSDWCGKGHPYEYTSEGCRMTQTNAGENKISPDQWDVILAQRVESSGVGMEAADIATIANTVAQNLNNTYPATYQSGATNAMVNGRKITCETNYSRKNIDAVNTQWRKNIAAAAVQDLSKRASYNDLMAYLNEKGRLSDDQKYCIGNSGVFYFTNTTTSNDKRAYRNAVKQIYDTYVSNLKAVVTKDLFVKKLRKETAPIDLGYVVVYTTGAEAEACHARQEQESAACIERVQSLIASGTVGTLTELNSQVSKPNSDET